MQYLLSLIWCWLSDFWATLADVGVEAYDAFLTIADGFLASLGNAGLTFPSIPDEYSWIFGVLGFSQALGIIASAMTTRFLLQTIPFVRWGS